MKTVTINLYSFNELSKEAKEKALKNWVYETEFFGADEAIETLKKFAEYFRSELKDYSIDWSNSTPGTFAKFEAADWLSELEILDLLQSAGTYDKETLRGHGDCKLTGVCYDEDVFDGFRKAWFAGERDLNELLQAGFKELLTSCESEFEAQQTEEYFSDHADANDYEFEEDGTIH